MEQEERKQYIILEDKSSSKIRILHHLGNLGAQSSMAYQQNKKPFHRCSPSQPVSIMNPFEQFHLKQLLHKISVETGVEVSQANLMASSSAYSFALYRIFQSLHYMLFGESYKAMKSILIGMNSLNAFLYKSYFSGRTILYKTRTVIP